MKRLYRNLIVKALQAVSIVAILALTITSVLAAPSGPTTYNQIGSSRYTDASGQQLGAYAGNTTEVNFHVNVSSQTWQGYFGNITGTIVLGNSANQSLYNWSLASPSGEVYATRAASAPTWTSIRCANITEITTEDTYLGTNQSRDPDAVNNTFLNTTTFPAFYTGAVPINTTQNCYAVNLNGPAGSPDTNFAQVLLSDNTNMIYTAIITQNSLGFDGRTHDFQMIVGDNGHLGDTTVTNYYFYLEIY